MNETQHSMPDKKYHVQVGLAECTVSCKSEKEAVRLARTRLTEKMPQMSEVIDGILDKHFRVDQVG